MYSLPGIFNVIDFGMVPGSEDSSVQTQNVIGLQAAIKAAQENGGGIVLIPSEYYGATIYYLNPAASITIPPPPAPSASIIILGTGDGTTLSITTSSDFISAVGVNDLVFQDLVINYVQTETGLSGTALTFDKCDRVRLFRLYFQDCQFAVLFENSLQANMLQCTIDYSSSFPTSSLTTATAVQLVGLAMSPPTSQGCEEASIDQCVFSFAATLNENTSATGLLIEQAQELHCLSTTITGFTTGILISPIASHEGAKNNFFCDITAQTASASAAVGAAVIIQPTGGASVQDTVFVDCTFSPSSGASLWMDGGVYIEQGGDNSSVDTVRFVSCSATGWNGPGIQIVSAQNIEILGGTYSSNGQSSSASLPAGIAVVGISGHQHPSNVRIVGASCAGAVYGNPQQEYGVWIESASQFIFVRDCDLTNNSQGPIYFNNPGDNVEVTDCAGYNDQATILSDFLGGSPTTIPLPGAPYYGPMTFYVAQAAEVQPITIDGDSTGLTYGAFTLAPGHSAELSYGPQPPGFLLIGN